MVLSHALWTRRFGSDPRLVGKTISLGGDPYVVVGVIGPSFDVSDFGPPLDLWLPFQLNPQSNDQGHYFQVAGRLKPGVTLAQAQARLKVSAAEYNRKFPNALQKDNSFSAQTLRDELVANVRPTLWLLLGAVSFVLLIACANVANLLLARATSRKREIAMRAAIGAGRGRIIRQLLTESVLLSVAGGVAGARARHDRHPRAARREYRRAAAHRRERFRRHARLARAGLHGRVVGRHWDPVRAHPGAPRNR